MNIEEEGVFLSIQFKNPIKVNKLSSTIERRLIGGDEHLAGGILRDGSRISVGCAADGGGADRRRAEILQRGQL